MRELVNDDEYLNGEFVTTVQQRGAAIIAARKFSSALSAASSVCDHVGIGSTARRRGRDLHGRIPGRRRRVRHRAGLMYSFPVTCAGGKWSIVQGLAIDDRSRSLMDATAAELKEEDNGRGTHRGDVKVEPPKVSTPSSDGKRDKREARELVI